MQLFLRPSQDRVRTKGLDSDRNCHDDGWLMGLPQGVGPEHTNRDPSPNCSFGRTHDEKPAVVVLKHGDGACGLRRGVHGLQRTRSLDPGPSIDCHDDEGQG